MSARFHRPPSARKLAVAIAEFNASVEIGAAVDVTLDDGSVLRTRTRSEAQILGGHTAVIWVDGIGGAYLLDRVKPAL